MSRRWRWIVAAVVAAMVFGFAYIIYQLEWEQVARVDGLQKKARTNPVFVLNKLLENHASRIEYREDFTGLFDPLTKQVLATPGKTGLFIDEKLFEDNPEIMLSLHQWVQAGGHLIYSISHSRTDDKTNWLFDKLSPGLIRADQAEKPIYDVTSQSGEVNAEFIVEPTIRLDLYIPYRFVLEACHAFHWQILSDTNQTLLCQIPMGGGLVTVLSDPGFLNGYGLRNADNASLAVLIFAQSKDNYYYRGVSGFNWINQLLGPNWIIYTLAGLLLLLLFWNLFARFGPSLVPLDQRYSHFGQHLEKLGGFYRRNGHEKQLKHVLLAELEAIMEQKKPGFADASMEKRTAILVKETAANQAFVKSLLDSESMIDNTLWLEQVRFVKDLKVTYE